MATGPVEYAVIAFPGNRFTGKIAPALADLVKNGTIRIIDLAFVMKDGNGDVAAMELSDLDPDVAAMFAETGAEQGMLFNEEDLTTAGEELEPNTSGLLLVWEDVWASTLVQAFRDADGVLLDFDRIPADVVDAARAAAKTG